MKKLRKIKNLRIIMIALILLSLFGILIVRLYRLQVVGGSEYADNFMLKTKREIRLKGVRGNIYDKNGKPLAVNQLVYAVTLEDKGTYSSHRERQMALNGEIYQLLRILKESGDSYVSHLEIALNKKGEYIFTAEGTALSRFRADVFGRISAGDMNEKESTATAEDIMTYLCSEDRFCLFREGGEAYSSEEKSKYGLPEKLTKEEILGIASIRYALSLKAYQKYLSVVVAENVSEKGMAAILEHQDEFTGVNIEEDTMRVYDGGEECAALLGYTGRISREELEETEKEGYTSDSVVGKTGLEKYLEEHLRGRDGTKEVLVDNMGRVIGDTGTVMQAQRGKDVYLSIDAALQKKTYHILERKIADILLDNMINAKTFDKDAVSDASQIRIPIYDIYKALFANDVIDVKHFQEEDASGLEKKIYRKFLQEKEELCGRIGTYLRNANKKRIKNQQEDMREYESFMIEHADILDESDEEHASAYQKKWETGEYSFTDYLKKITANGWLRSDILKDGGDYQTLDEMYEHAVSYLLAFLKESADFDIEVYKYMVMNAVVSPDEICQLLYDQKIIKKKDDIYRKWKAGEMPAYEFIRVKIQNLEITPADLALDPCSGSAVITDPSSGEILACVSYPGYDNNKLANRMDNAYYSRITKNASLPLYNRATQQLSAPGSTFKPITIIAGLEEGAVTSRTTVKCDGIFDKVSPSLKCWNHAGHGAVTSVSAALRHSCNDYLCEVSYRLGLMGNKEFSDAQALKFLQKYAEMFCLNEKSGIELPESSPQITDCYAIPSAIGQGTNNFSTVQLGRYVNILANRGKAYPLTLIGAIGTSGKDMSRMQETSSEIHQEAAMYTTQTKAADFSVRLSKETWDSVQKGMEWYVQNTGIFKGCKITAAGKSGTAQENKRKPDHSLFIGYAPADAPEISVAVRIVNGYTSENAVSCGREIIETYFGRKNHTS